MEDWNNGMMERKNINRGFRRLRVWNDAVDLYVLIINFVSAKLDIKTKITS
jgi:hypothetical protein